MKINEFLGALFYLMLGTGMMSITVLVAKLTWSFFFCNQ